jgi:competence protein ComEC
MYKKHIDLLLFIGITIGVYMGSILIANIDRLEHTGQYDVKVKKVYYYSDYSKIIGTINRKSVNIYINTTDTFLIGSTYQFRGELERPESPTIPGTFDYRKYLLSLNTKYIIKAKSYEYLKTGFSLYQIGSTVEDYIDRRLPESKGYIKTFILADKTDIDQRVKDNVNYLGISHMFAVSGYHVGLLVLGLEWIGKQLKIKQNRIQNFNSVLLVIYMIITSFSASVVRASLLYIGLVFNRRFQWKLSPLDLLSMIFIGLLVTRPYYYYNMGFVLSFFITASLLLSQNILKRYSSFYTICMVSVIAFLMSFPIVINNTHQINLMTLVFNVVIIYLMSFVILPFTYITFLLPVFDPILTAIYKAFESLLSLLSRIDILVFQGSIPVQMGIMIIYIMIIYLIIRIELRKTIKWSLTSLVLVILLCLNTSKYDIRKQVVFLDVYGDSSLIKDKNDRCNILIDTGETDDYDTVIEYLHYKQIRRLDYLIVSHFHSDHYGEADDIINQLQVTTVITNQNAAQYEGQWTTCGSLSFYIYPMTYDSLNENNNSILLSLMIEDDEYLFVGDSETEREEEFLAKYNLNPDYLKVGHHGSITSSNEAFIDALSPREVFVIVARDNRHGHPSNIVMERFDERGIPIYRTDLYGTIEVSYNRGKETKKYHRP